MNRVLTYSFLIFVAGTATQIAVANEKNDARTQFQPAKLSDKRPAAIKLHDLARSEDNNESMLADSRAQKD